MGSTVVPESDFTKPLIRRKTLTARNAGTMTTQIDCGEHGRFILDEPVAHGGEGRGPSPLQGVLGCLCGCESVTFNRTAAEFGFAYDGIEFEAAYTIDVRGRMGLRGVVPHFQSVKVQAFVKTDEPQERLRAVVEETEARCPVYNLIRDAGVRVEIVWVARPTGLAV